MGMKFSCTLKAFVPKPQVRGDPNFACTKSHVYAVFKCLIDPAIRSNSGFFGAFNISASEGRFVNPQHRRHQVAASSQARFTHMASPLFGAMAQAIVPEQRISRHGAVCFSRS